MFCECTHIALHVYESTNRTFAALWEWKCLCLGTGKEGKAALTQLPPEVSRSNGSVPPTSTDLGSSPGSDKVRKVLRDFEIMSCIQAQWEKCWWYPAIPVHSTAAGTDAVFLKQKPTCPCYCNPKKWCLGAEIPRSSGTLTPCCWNTSGQLCSRAVLLTAGHLSNSAPVTQSPCRGERNILMGDPDISADPSTFLQINTAIALAWGHREPCKNI